MTDSNRSTQQLAEFVAAVSTADSETAAAQASVERAAEAIDADVAAIVCGNDIVAAIGYPEHQAPVDELAKIRPGFAGGQLIVPGVGSCAAAAAALEHPPDSTMVVARSGALTREEIGLLRGMARVASTTMRMLCVLDDERNARQELERLAGEQAALRRVATLVATAAAPDEIFCAITDEVAQLSRADIATVLRFEPDGSATVLGTWGDHTTQLPIGTRLMVAGEGVAVSVLANARPERSVRFRGPRGSVPDALRRAGAQVGCGSPIVVDGCLWGVVIAARTRPDPFPPHVEHRIADFTELAGTAIANAQAHDELKRLAGEQAALRRAATQVARGEPPAAVFAAVAEEVGRTIRADLAYVVRYEEDEFLTVAAAWHASGETAPSSTSVGARVPGRTGTVSALVRRTGRAARIGRYPGDAGTPILGIRSAVGAPITVDGRLWGLIAVASKGEELPPSTMERLSNFTDIAATAVANAEAKAALTASRARIVTTADETRRRIERDLHDGAQQRLVSLALQMRAVQAAVPPEVAHIATELDRLAVGLTNTLDELREFARGIHPAILTDHGLGPALKALTRRCTVPVQLNMQVACGGLPDAVEVGAYYVVSEALANVSKHAHASVVTVDVERTGAFLQVLVRDDGVGGAEVGRGSGLVGVKDRVEALGGRIAVTSPPGQGTSLEIQLPAGGNLPRPG